MIYQIKTKFCTGEEKKETFYEPDAACGVYALRLGDMLMKNKIVGVIPPDITDDHGVHIVEVIMIDAHIGRDADEDNYILVSSGRFPCEKEEKVSA